MAVTDASRGQLSESEHNAHLRRAVIASTVGTTIEWYDFLIYSTMTGLVFGHVFFSGADALLDTLKAFGVFFVGFIARPIGATQTQPSTALECVNCDIGAAGFEPTTPCLQDTCSGQLS